jgi:hypothetical protein
MGTSALKRFRVDMTRRMGMCRKMRRLERCCREKRVVGSRFARSAMYVIPLQHLRLACLIPVLSLTSDHITWNVKSL